MGPSIRSTATLARICFATPDTVEYAYTMTSGAHTIGQLGDCGLHQSTQPDVIRFQRPSLLRQRRSHQITGLYVR